MELVLGTVQLGLDYGVSNQKGQVTQNEAKNLLAYAHSIGINTLDTAALYGNSEQVLGQFANPEMAIITKFKAAPGEDLFNQLKTSLAHLKRHAIQGVLLHDADILASKENHHVIEQLNEMKAQKRVKKIGVSLYHPKQAELFNHFTPDIIQIPFNMLDRRFNDNQLLTHLKKQNIEIHARSVFLQGLLLLPPSHRPTYFEQFDILKEFDDLVENSNYSRLETCLGFMKSITEIDKLVVGCCNMNELQQIHRGFNHVKKIHNDTLNCSDQQLIIPSNWPNK